MFTNTQIGTTDTTLLLTATGETRLVTSIILCNTDTVDHTVFLYAIASGGSLGVGTMIANGQVIKAGETYIWTSAERLIPENGDRIAATADVAAKVTATVNSIAQ